MGEGLFPKRSAGWWLLVILGAVYYSVYYLQMYPSLYEAYLGAYEHPAQAHQCDSDVSIRVRAPQYISEYVQRTLTVSVTNLTDDPIEQLTIGVSPVGDDQDWVDVSAQPSALALTKPEEGNILPGFIQFGSIPANATTSGVFNIYAKQPIGGSGETGSKHISLQLYCDGKPMVGSISIEYDRDKIMRHSLIEAALLPPWSNGILAFLALLVVKLVEDTFPENKASRLEKLLRHLWVPVMAAGLSLLLLLAVHLGAEVDLPGLPSQSVLYGGIACALIVSFLIRLALWRITGTLDPKGLGILISPLVNRFSPKAPVPATGGPAGGKLGPDGANTCRVCGKSVSVEAKFCPNCGNPVSTAPESQ